MKKSKTITERLAQLEASMDAIANTLEGSGFHAQMKTVDMAAGLIEDLREEFEAVNG
jgi:hypothetical protein